MEIIQHIRTRSGKSYYTKTINFTQGGHIEAKIIDIRNRQEVFIDCVLIDYIHICSAIEAEDVPFPITDKSTFNSSDILGQYPYTED